MPNGTAAVNNVRIASPATSVHQGLNGSGYVYLEAIGSYAVVDMTTFTLPPGAVILSITNKATCQALSDSPIYMDMYRQGCTAVAHNGPQAYTPGWVYLTNTNTNSGGVALSTQADIDNYQLVLSLPALTAASNWVYALAYVVFQYIGLPTVNVGQPLNGSVHVVSAIPVSWSFVKDVDSPTSQSKYQVRLFTYAQSTVGGFDPGTATPLYDTGVVASAGLSTTVPVKASGQYIVYIRAAHTNSGKDQWSTWRSTASGFTVNLKSVYYWNGSSFVLSPTKVWNGTAFVDPTNIKVWNGSAWINAVNG